jgi:hypothetical protein
MFQVPPVMVKTRLVQLDCEDSKRGTRTCGLPLAAAVVVVAELEDPAVAGAGAAVVVGAEVAAPAGGGGA